VPAARATHRGPVSASQRFGLGREAEVVKNEMRFYARRGRPTDLRVFRTVATCKFGLKTLAAALLGRPQAVSTYGRVVRACVLEKPA